MSTPPQRTKADVPVPAMTTMPSPAPTPAYRPLSASLPLLMDLTKGSSRVSTARTSPEIAGAPPPESPAKSASTVSVCPSTSALT